MNMNKNTSGLIIVDEKYCFEEETHLTVHKTSVFFPGDGFIVYDTRGQVLLRFDSYGPGSQPKDELVLMDSSGECLLTLSRKKPSLHQRWEGYIGEKKEDQEPSFTTHRSSIIGRSEVLVEVYGGDADEEYHIQGSYSQRNCTFYKSSRESSSREPMAEIKRKVDPTTHVMLGKDVFLLVVKPTFDCPLPWVWCLFLIKCMVIMTKVKIHMRWARPQRIQPHNLFTSNFIFQNVVF